MVTLLKRLLLKPPQNISTHHETKYQTDHTASKFIKSGESFETSTIRQLPNCSTNIIILPARHSIEHKPGVDNTTTFAIHTDEEIGKESVVVEAEP